MTKFDYKKWVVENKHGKSPNHSNYAGTHGILNEQADLTSSYAGCILCPEGAATMTSYESSASAVSGNVARIFRAS